MLCSTIRSETANYFEIEIALIWNEQGHWAMVERDDVGDAVEEISESEQLRTTFLKIRLPKPEITETIVHVRSNDTKPLSSMTCPPKALPTQSRLFANSEERYHETKPVQRGTDHCHSA